MLRPSPRFLCRNTAVASDQWLVASNCRFWPLETDYWQLSDFILFLYILMTSDRKFQMENQFNSSNHSVVVTVSDPLGLHLRSGKDVARIASQFQAQITASNLSRNSGVVDMKSILQLMQLQARQGHDLRLAASGPDAAAAIAALCSLF